MVFLSLASLLTRELLYLPHVYPLEHLPVFQKPKSAPLGLQWSNRFPIEWGFLCHMNLLNTRDSLPQLEDGSIVSLFVADSSGIVPTHLSGHFPHTPFLQFGVWQLPNSSHSPLPHSPNEGILT